MFWVKNSIFSLCLTFTIPGSQKKVKITFRVRSQFSTTTLFAFHIWRKKMRCDANCVQNLFVQSSHTHYPHHMWHVSNPCRYIHPSKSIIVESSRKNRLNSNFKQISFRFAIGVSDDGPDANAGDGGGYPLRSRTPKKDPEKAPPPPKKKARKKKKYSDDNVSVILRGR